MRKREGILYFLQPSDKELGKKIKGLRRAKKGLNPSNHERKLKAAYLNFNLIYAEPLSLFNENY